MPSETLEYRFTERGLDELRSDMEALAEDTEDVGEAAESAEADLENMGSADPGEDVAGGLGQAEGALSDVSEEAARAAQRLQESFGGATQEALSRISEMGQALEDFNQQQIDVSGGQLTSAVGGSAAGAALGAGGAAAIAGELAQATEPARQLERQTSEVSEEAREIAQIYDRTAQEVQQAASEASELSQETGEAESGASDLINKLREIAIPSLGGGSGDGIDNLGDAAADAAGDFGGFSGAIARAGSRLTGLLSTTAGVATAIGAIGTAGAIAGKQVADFAAQAATAGQQLKVLEAQSGVSSRKAQRLFQVAQQLDSTVDLDSIRDAFKELALRTQEAREGTGEAKEAFEELGISVSELEGMSTAEVFQRVRQEAQKLTAQQRALTLEQVAGGEAGERLARVLGLTREQFNRLAGAVSNLSNKQTRTLDRLRTQYTQYNQRLRQARLELAAAFGPPAVTILKKLTSAIEPVTALLTDLARKWRMNAAAALEFFGVLSEQEALDVAGMGQNPDTSEGEGSEESPTTTSGRQEGKSPRQRMGEALNQQAKRIARIRERAEKGLASQQEMLRQIVSARESAFKELQKLGQKAPDLFTDKLMSHLASQIKRLQRRLEQATEEEVQIPAQDVGSDVSTVEGAPMEELPTPGMSTEGIGQDMKQRAANMRRAYEAELSELERFGKAVGESLTRSVARSVDRAFSALGQGLVGALFGSGSGGRGEEKARLNLFNAKKQVRSLRKSLRQGNLSYRNFQLKMQAQQAKIQKRQEQLNDTMRSGFAKAADSMLQAFKQIAKQLIAEVTAVIAKMAVLKAITAAFSISSGGFGGAVISSLGGGAFLDSGASGGMVKQSGLAVIHENEQIMNAKTVSMLDDMLQPSTPSAQPAMATAGGGMNLTVRVEGQTRTDGRDIVTSYNNTTATQRRKGRRN